MVTLAFGLRLLLAGVISGAATVPAVAQLPTTSAPAPVANANDQDIVRAYILGPDDVIEVDVLGQPEFKTRAKIRANGTIALPFIGDINANGATTLAFGEQVAQKLRAGGYYSKPIMNVEIVSFASRYVVVLGDVGTPGLQPVDRAYRVSEIIARAGGMRETGADFVIVRRATGEELKLPFRKLAAGSLEDDPVISPGDKVFVPPAELFYIYGQISAPGAYPIKEEMSLRKALARSGGITPSGSAKRIKVFRDGKETKVDLEHIIQPGEVIVVGERLF